MDPWLLREKVTRVIPACALTAIRTEFPDSNGVYTGFKDEEDSNTETEIAWEFSEIYSKIYLIQNYLLLQIDQYDK